MSGISAQPRWRFRRSARLLKRPDFERVYQQGRRTFARHLTVFYLRRAEGGPRVGFTVGRALGGAVERNRIRRRLREAVRRRLPELEVAADLVVHPKKSALTVDFTQLLDEVGQAFDAIRRSPQRSDQE